MEWLIIIAGTALGLIPLATEVSAGWEKHKTQRQREEEARQRAAYEAQLRQLEQREQTLLLEMRQGMQEGAHLQRELDRLHLERLQLTGREL